MSCARYIGVDESGSLTDRIYRICIVAAAGSDDVFDTRRTHLERQKKLYAPEELEDGLNYRYIVLTPELLEAARDAYQFPTTRIEESWNGKLPEFKMRSDAISSLLKEFGFDTGESIAYVDSYCRCVHLRDLVAHSLGRIEGQQIDPKSIKCSTGADIKIPLVKKADDIAYSLRHYLLEQGREFPEKRVNFTADDLLRPAA